MRLALSQLITLVGCAGEGVRLYVVLKSAEMGHIAIGAERHAVAGPEEGLQHFRRSATVAAMPAAGERLNFENGPVQHSRRQGDPAPGAARRMIAMKDETNMLGLPQAGNAGSLLLHGTNGNSFLLECCACRALLIKRVPGHCSQDLLGKAWLARQSPTCGRSPPLE